MLEIKNISKSFGNKLVLDDVSFRIKKKQVAALLGENGAGKSTLLRILSGYFEADKGSIKFDDVCIHENRRAFLQKIGYVQEISALYGDMRVYDFLHFAADLRQTEKTDTQKIIETVIKALQLEQVLTQKNETLSKGFKKRVELAAVLTAKPDIMLLDEPTEGLDPNQKIIIRQIIRQYAKQNIVLISTHTLEDVDALANKVLLLHKGK